MSDDPNQWTVEAVEYRFEKMLSEAVFDAVASVCGLAGGESNVAPDPENDDALIVTAEDGSRTRVTLGWITVKEGIDDE